MTEESERTHNFLRNWIDANIEHPSQARRVDVEAAERQFLTDAVAAGLTMDQVNENWPSVVAQIEQAAKARCS